MGIVRLPPSCVRLVLEYESCPQVGTGWGAGNYGAGVHLIRFRVHMNVRGGKFPVGCSGIFRSILHPEGMKRTGNQKVVTALLSESLYKGSYLPHIRLVLAYLIRNTIYAVTIPNRGLWRVAIYRFQIGELPPGAIQ